MRQDTFPNSKKNMAQLFSGFAAKYIVPVNLVLVMAQVAAIVYVGMRLEGHLKNDVTASTEHLTEFIASVSHDFVSNRDLSALKAIENEVSGNEGVVWSYFKDADGRSLTLAEASEGEVLESLMFTPNVLGRGGIYDDSVLVISKKIKNAGEAPMTFEVGMSMAFIEEKAAKIQLSMGMAGLLICLLLTGLLKMWAGRMPVKPRQKELTTERTMGRREWIAPVDVIRNNEPERWEDCYMNMHDALMLNQGNEDILSTALVAMRHDLNKMNVKAKKHIVMGDKIVGERVNAPKPDVKNTKL